MTVHTFASANAREPDPGGAYQPGVCNIGPAEIARRRMTGHVGVLATVTILAALVLLDAPPLTRLILIVPATLAASGYLQAALKFCAGFGSRGVFNFGPLGEMLEVGSAENRARDRRRSWQIGLGGLAIGIVVGLLAVVLPV